MPTYGDLLLRQGENGRFETARKVPMGFTNGRNQ